ncbi:MAG: hypothetical protein QW724_06435 [Nitrososphaerota archaeon]
MPARLKRRIELTARAEEISSRDSSPLVILMTSVDVGLPTTPVEGLVDGAVETGVGGGVVVIDVRVTDTFLAKMSVKTNEITDKAMAATIRIKTRNGLNKIFAKASSIPSILVIISLHFLKLLYQLLIQAYSIGNTLSWRQDKL